MTLFGGLSGAVNSASTSITVSSQGLQATAENIANSQTPGYIKRQLSTEELVYSGIGSGVGIASLVPAIDNYLLGSMITQNSVAAKSAMVSQYFSNLEITLGDPNQQNHISAAINKFYDILETLTQHPEAASSRQNAVSQAASLANLISQTAYQIHNLRFSADQDIKTAISELNLLLNEMAHVNQESATSSADPNIKASIINQRVQLLEKISKYVNINFFVDSSGFTNISTSNGVSILDQNNYSITYSAAPTVYNFIDNLYINPLQISIVQEDGTTNNPFNLISGGYENSITSILKGGSIAALQQLRDVELPQLLEKLDSLASQFASQINAEHNTSGGYNPAATLIGQNLFASTDMRDWSGKVKIAVVDENGNSVLRPPEGNLGKQRQLRPLTIDFDTLNCGSGAGASITMDCILNEINEYYFTAPVEGRVRMGDLRGASDPTGSGGVEDIKMVSMQATTAPGGTFIFDFEIDNAHRNNYNVEVLSLAINNGGTITTTNNSQYISEAGTRTRTGDANTITLSGAAGTTYTITARIEITDAITNDVSVSDITYQVTDSETNAYNHRYSATSASGANTVLGTDGGAYIPPSTVLSVLNAQIVNANGVGVAAGTAGYTKIVSSNPASYRIVIDDLDSSENGLAGSTTIKETKRGLSHFLGLNNLFVENSTFRGSAYKLAVRSDITGSSGYNLLSIGKLDKSAGVDIMDVVGVKKASGTFQLLSVPAVGDTLTINGLAFTFDNAGATSTTIDRSSGVLSTVVTNIAAKLNASNLTLTQSGVNLATYIVDANSSNLIKIEANAAGTTANVFTLAANFAAATASINNGAASITPSGTLGGGADNPLGKVTKQAYAYSLGRGDKQVVEKMLADRSSIIIFPASQSFTAVQMSIQDFANQNFVSYIANLIADAANTATNDKYTYQQFYTQFTAGTGVNINEEMINMVKFQASFNASAKIIATVNKLYDTLIMSF